MDEVSYEAGQRSAATRLLSLALRELGYEGTEAEQAKWFKEREETVAALRSICEEYGDNDWDVHLCLSDVIEKHLHRHLDSEVEPDEYQGIIATLEEEGYLSLARMIEKAKTTHNRVPGSSFVVHGSA